MPRADKPLRLVSSRDSGDRLFWVVVHDDWPEHVDFLPMELPGRNLRLRPVHLPGEAHYWYNMGEAIEAIDRHGLTTLAGSDRIAPVADVDARGVLKRRAVGSAAPGGRRRATAKVTMPCGHTVVPDPERDDWCSVCEVEAEALEAEEEKRLRTRHDPSDPGITDRRIAYLRSLGEDKRNTPAWRDAMHERDLVARSRRVAASEDAPREPPVRTRRSQRERVGRFEDAGIALMYGAVKTAQGWAPQVWENGRELMSTYAVGYRDRPEAERLALRRAEEQRERFSGDWHITIEPNVQAEPAGLARRRRGEHAAAEPSGLDRIYNVSLIETWRDDCGPDEEYTRERLALYVRACRSHVRGVPSNEPTPAGAEAWAQFERRAAAQERAGQLRADMLAAADTFEQLARKLK